MAKILAIGGALPEFNRNRRIVAVSYRMEQFVAPLLRDGHDVIVCGKNAYDSAGDIIISRKGRLVHHQIDRGDAEFRAKAQTLHDELRPDCVLGIGRMDARVTADLRSDAPMWIDLFGDANCEAQSKAFVFDDDFWVRSFWDYDEPIFERADVFSACGGFQEHFLTGVLSVLGRLNKRTFGYRFVYGVPPAIPEETITRPAEKDVLRGSVLDSGDFAVLWSGGYNVWTDVDTLFQALERAFAADPAIKFVSLGGKIENHDERTYPRFERMVAGSRYRDNFKLLGWRSHAEALKAYGECDLGVSIDRYHYEPVYGTRTRIIEMIQSRLPVATSLACELSVVLRDNALGLTFPCGDPATLAERIVAFARQPRPARAALAGKAYDYFQEHFTYAKTTEPFRAWVKNPVRAPDADRRLRPTLPLRSNLDHWRRFIEEAPEDNISLKRLLANKMKAKYRKLFR